MKTWLTTTNILTKKAMGVFCLCLCTNMLMAQTAQEYFTTGQQKRSQRKYAEAVTAFTDALSINATLVQAYELRGYCYASLRKHRAALADYNKAIKMGYENAMLYFNRGWAHYNLGNKVQACYDWEKSNLMGYKGAERILKKYCGF